MAWPLLCETDVRPLASRILPARPQARVLGAVYAAIAVSVAIVALAYPETPGARRLAIVLLGPLGIAFLLVAGETALAITRDWRSRTLAARVRSAIVELGGAYRIVTVATAPTREDQVVIGPNGVFVVVACDDGGRVTASAHRLFVNARRPWRTLVEDCRVEALRVGERVRRSLGRPVPVHAVLCFSRALVAVGQEVRGVKVVQLARLARVIASTAAPTVLGADERQAAEDAISTSDPVRLVRPKFRPTARRRALALAERPLRLIGRSPASRHHAS